MTSPALGKIAVYYPAFLGGGAETVALWMLEALKEKYELTLFTVSDIDFERLNAMYGTTLNHQKIRVKSLFPKFSNSITDFLIANNKQIRMLLFHLSIRHIKARQEDYDLLISAYNAADLGKKTIQYIHWVKVLEGNWWWEKVSNFSIAQLKKNPSLSNSQLVHETVLKTYGIDSTVLYPPVVLDIPNKAQMDKENAFICSGRITEAKQPDQVIKILQQVRAQGFDVKLHLTGGGGGTYALKYERSIKKLATENADWITLYENLEYADYVNVVTRCKYGIHYKKEPFGISIAEMVKADVIPFVRSQGGQVEIVGAQNQELLFGDEAEAIAKIIAVLSSPEKQSTLLESLKAQKQLFSTQRFMAEMTKFVDDYFERDSGLTGLTKEETTPSLLLKEAIQTGQRGI
ncbi:MAG: glycosyltransferase [Timaviella obliquedivisa GSE-PSE-MK23-08B]|jgi:glycosyltransferase involved in cell wall biosynthesis|nr:glycosyltransferase [Timaviella obliquedivisa GSE-PSE-MK23-08B]